MPEFAGKGNQSGICAVFLEPFRTFRSCEVCCPVLQIVRHGGGTDRLLESNCIGTNLVHSGGHIVLRPGFVFPVCHAVQRILIQFFRIAFGKGHVHGKSRQMAECTAGGEPILTVTHLTGFFHVRGHGSIAVDQSAETIAHGGLHISGAERLINDQRLTVRHSGLLDSRQPLGQGVHTGNDVFFPVQPEIHLLGGIEPVSCHIGDFHTACGGENTAAGIGQVISDAGQDIRQIDKDILFINPSGSVHSAAGPGDNRAGIIRYKADFHPFAAVVLQNGEENRCGAIRCGNGYNFRCSALGIINRQWVAGAIPAGGACDVHFKIAGCSVYRIRGEGCGGEHPNDCQQNQQHRERPPPVGFYLLRKRLQHEHFPPLIFCFGHKKRPHGVCGLAWERLGLFIRGMGGFRCMFPPF